ncbi:MAG: hydrogenase 3 maturation endopeptidase HyCI [Coriobacteriia bacterium]|nr:hydrogenase 3 maturation endopeptidase HyCI [Coriobacteriia bacterium]
MLRADDAAGTMIAERLEGLQGRAQAFAGYSAPENLTGEIKRFSPDIVLVIDAIDLGVEPGEVRVIELDEIGGVSFSTHMLPLKIIIEYLRQETGAEVVLLGIQVSSIEFMQKMTEAVRATVDAIVDSLEALLV